MLLRAGVIMMAFSLLLAAGVAVTVSLLRPDAPVAQESQVEPLAAEATAQEKEFDPGEKLDIKDEPRREESKASPKSATSDKKPASPQRKPESSPISNADWPVPTRGELASVGQPRYYEPLPGAVMTLTISALGLYDVPILDSNTPEALDQGLIHVPDTAYPWDRGSEKNVFLAGHRLGWPGTGSRLVFYQLDQLRSGDQIILKDRNGNAYEYRVIGLFTTSPNDAWVADTLVGQDLLTLQTCTGPNFENRLIVWANRA